jgi:uncharacterized membrane protein YdbT with pleckstrin-like domain
VIFLELFYFVVPILRWALDTFELTAERVSADQGIVYRKHQEISTKRISQVIIERGFLDLIFGSGTIKMYDAANTLGLEFKDVPRVKQVKELIDSVRENVG